MHPNNIIKEYKAIQIQTRKLDSILINNKIGFIKIDVEGHEKNVLMGGEYLIKKINL